MIWYDVIILNKRMSVANSVALYDLIRHTASYDDAVDVEKWANEFEKKMEAGMFYGDLPDACIFVDRYDGEPIKIFAVVC